MMSFAEARHELALRHRTIEEDGEGIVLAVAVVDEESPAVPWVRAELVTAFAEPWLLLLSPIVHEPEVRAHDALAFNMRLAVGALALDAGVLFLRAALRLRTLEVHELLRTVTFIAAEASRLQRLHRDLRDGARVLDLFRE